MSVLKGSAVTAVALLLAVGPAMAGQKGGKHGPAPKATGASAHAPKTNGAAAHAPTTTTTKASHPVKAPKATTTPPTTTATPTATTGTVETTPAVSPKIARHPKLETKVANLLPAGMTFERAASGFRNQGQFIAALHVSQNLGIPFVDLKRAMTGPDAKSLGQAIQTLKPFANATTETARAEREATVDLR